MKKLAGMLLAVFVVAACLAGAASAATVNEVLAAKRAKLGLEKAAPRAEQIFESDFMWLSPSSISGAVNSTVQVVGKLTTEREIAGFGIGFLFDETKVDLLSIQMGQEIPQGWEIYTQWDVDGQGGAWIIGSGGDEDWFSGVDQRIAIFTFKILQCGTGTTIDLVGGNGGPDCNWSHLATSTLVSIIAVDCPNGCTPPSACPQTLYLTDGYAGGTNCPCPPCGCSCEVEKHGGTGNTLPPIIKDPVAVERSTWTATKELFR